ncbi:UDP-glucose 4-epimerase family protein [Hydrogenophaga luteola]|uniref:UDP-glucose 4-epimerase family protein n=1 Tax=Hydrogenophaga luteola TaxID=1591122 RepID=A0ABV7W733_9BURK
MTVIVAVTGAHGFVGRALCQHLKAHGFSVRAITRSVSGAEDTWAVGDLGPETDWGQSLKGVDCVVHCAARVHMLQDTDPDPLQSYRRVNVDGSRSLAVAAASAGVRRLVFLSSLKVHGERTAPGHPFTSDMTPAPEDAYGQSKWEAELALQDVARRTGLELVVVRPPLVYGPGVKANFLKLMKAVARGTPLPLGAVDNRRSLLALDNLTDLLHLCVEHPAAAGHTFLASDGLDLSTPDLVRALARAMGRPARLWPVPVAWLRMAGKLLGRGPQIDRLIGSLQVDIGHTRRVLGWTPRLAVEQGLRLAVQDVVA